MSIPVATRQSHPDEPRATIPHRTRWRLTLLRMVAAAHLLAGAVIALSIVANVALRLDYSGGPMGYYGSESIAMASCLHTLTHLRVWTATEFWARIDAYSVWLSHHVQTSPEFFGLMAGVHLALAGLCAAIGYGLWRCHSWARRTDQALLGICAAFSTSHGVALLAGGNGYFGEGLQIIEITAVVVGPILIFHGSAKTAVLFDPSVLPENGAAQKRRWWTLSAQWLGIAMMCVFALGLVRLMFVGPLVEVVWVSVLFTRYQFGF